DSKCSPFDVLGVVETGADAKAGGMLLGAYLDIGIALVIAHGGEAGGTGPANLDDDQISAIGRRAQSNRSGSGARIDGIGLDITPACRFGGTRSETEPVEVADPAVAAIGVEGHFDDVLAGGQVDAGLGDRGPGLPAAGVGDAQAAADIDAVDFDVQGAA